MPAKNPHKQSNKSIRQLNPNSSVDTEAERISNARSSLLLNNPFIGNIALTLKMVVVKSPRIPTAATDGRTVWYNPDFTSVLTNNQLKFVVAHEIMHPVFMHMTRCGDRNPLVWNIAGDYVINYILVQDGIGEFFDGLLYDEALYIRCEGVTERIYDELMKDPEIQKMVAAYEAAQSAAGQDGEGPPGAGMGGKEGGPLDYVGKTPSDSIANEEAEWRMKVSQAADAAKAMGKLSGNMARFVSDMLEAKVPWQDVLRKFVVSIKTDDRSYARPNRRFVSKGVYFPIVTGEGMGDIVIAIDCSGSIGERELNEFAAEIRAIHQDARPANIHVVYFDSVVCHYDVFSREDTLKIAPHGGGGTAFSPIFKFVEDNDIEPLCCVVLTDLCCNDFGPEPAYPTLWVTNAKGKAPWGEILEMF